MYISYPILEEEPSVLHFTSTKNGGVSCGNYSSLNLGRYSNDHLLKVQKNFELFFAALNLGKENTHIPFQTHENKVLKIDQAFLQLNNSQKDAKLHGIDALITNIPKQCIIVSTADCVPILLFDTENQVVAAIHAGWRSTRLRIAENTIEQMKKHYGTNPKHIKAVIGVSISPEVYEVGEEVKKAFEEAAFNVETIFFQQNNKLHLDLWQANRIQLVTGGLTEENIEISALCSFTDSERFFSARRQGINSGRMISGIMIK